MRVRNIAVIVIGLDEEYQYNVIRGINQYAREHDVNISYFAAFGGVVDSRKFDLGEFSIFNLTNFSYFDGGQGADCGPRPCIRHPCTRL